ncbi:MAG TPA: DUF167 domain-containing protein [Polyangiaceae bacterium]|jgi:hypothetical protein
MPKPAGGTVRISVRAKPRAKKSAVLKADGLTVDVALAAPPVDGAANEELLAVLAEALGIPKRALALVVGASSKSKVVAVEGMAEGDVVARLAQAARG